MMSKKNMTLTLLAIFLCGGLLAACGAKEEESVDVITYMYDAGEFITNIKDSGKMLSCAIKMDLISESLLTTLAEKDYVARDVIVRRLRQLTEDDLASANIEDSLAKSLAQELNKSMNTEGFFKVYFVRFVYQ